MEFVNKTLNKRDMLFYNSTQRFNWIFLLKIVIYHLPFGFNIAILLIPFNKRSRCPISGNKLLTLFSIYIQFGKTVATVNIQFCYQKCQTNFFCIRVVRIYM